MSKRPKCRAARRGVSPPPVAIVSGGSRGAKLRAVAKDAPTIFIDGDIGRKDQSSALVREQIVSFGDVSEMVVRINSDGGSTMEGMAIFLTLRRSKGHKIGIVEGVAASMASVILQACDERQVTRGSYVMIHNPSIESMGGESSDFARAAELLDKIREDMLDIYEARSGQSREKIIEMMNATTYMTAEEAVELGFADSIADEDAKIVERAVARLDRKKLPKALKAKLEKSKMDEEEMKAKIAALEEENAKLKAKASDEDEEASDEEETEEEEASASDDEDDDDKEEESKAKAIAKLVRRITGKKSLDEIEGQLMALTSRNSLQVTAQRKSRVEALVSAGKLAPVSRKWALSCSAKALSSYEKAMGDDVIVPVGKRHNPPVAGSSTDPSNAELSAAEKQVAKAMGATNEQALKARALKIENGKVA